MLVLNDLNKIDKQVVLKKLMSEFPGNTMVLNYWYAYKPSLTHEDILNLNELLKTDVTSTDKKLILARHYLIQKQPEKAEMYLQQIKDSDCDNDCLKIKSKASFYHKALLLTDTLISKAGMPLSPFDRTVSIFISLVFYISIVLVPAAGRYIAAIKRRQSPRIKKEMQQKAD